MAICGEVIVDSQLLLHSFLDLLRLEVGEMSRRSCGNLLRNSVRVCRWHGVPSGGARGVGIRGVLSGGDLGGVSCRVVDELL